jgi:hypothetical protein
MSVRNLVLGLGLAAGALFAVGCLKNGSAGKKAEDAAKDAAKEVKDAAKDVKEAAKDAAGKATAWTKEEVVKPIADELPTVEAKIKTMSGDAQVGAQKAFDEFKKQLDEFRAAPNDKLRELGEKLKEAFAKLKVQVGV